MRRSAFTLVEMLVVITIIAILAGMVMAALGGAAESAKVQRARQQIAKIDQLINEKWNSYRYRQVPVRIPAGTQPVYAQRMRLETLRELMRLELPERLTDIQDDPVSPSTAIQDPTLVSKGIVAPVQSRPSLSRAYLRRVTPQAASTLSYDQAECLYLIIEQMQDGDRSALNFFMSSEIGDVDGDGMKEILDPWGTPIMWLRWAPGYSSVVNADLPAAEQVSPPWPIITEAVATPQIASGTQKPDPFDPLKSDPRWNDADNFMPFELRPLIFSAGPDRVYDIYIDPKSTTLHYKSTTPANDPYTFIVDPTGNKWMGMPADANNDGLNHADNITNHYTATDG